MACGAFASVVLQWGVLVGVRLFVGRVYMLLEVLGCKTGVMLAHGIVASIYYAPEFVPCWFCHDHATVWSNCNYCPVNIP